jgi:type I restriction enzyme, S subunit
MISAALGELADINPKGPAPGEIGSADLCCFVPMAALGEDGNISGVERRTYSELMKGYTPFRNNDVLLAKITPCYENNKIGLARVNGSFAFGSTEFHVIRCHNERLDPKYLTYFLRQDRVRFYGERRMTGTGGQRRVPRAFLEGLEIPLPILAQQKRIAAILEKADDIRRKREGGLVLADKVLKSIFWRTFFESGHAWPCVPLGSVAELINGDRSSNYPSGKDIVSDGILFLNTRNIKDSELVFDDTAYITAEKFASLSRGKLQRYDLVITLRGSIGQCAIFDCEYETGFINAQLMIIRPSTDILPEFLHHCILHPAIQNRLMSAKTGSAVPQLTARQIGELEIPLPPIEMQRDFTEMADAVFRDQQRQKDSLNASIALFNSLSQRAFRGEL